MEPFELITKTLEEYLAYYVGETPYEIHIFAFNRNPSGWSALAQTSLGDDIHVFEYDESTDTCRFKQYKKSHDVVL